MKERKKEREKKERKKGLLYRILNLPRPPRPMVVGSESEVKWRIKVSSNLSKLRTPIVHADLIFLYLQNAAKQNRYGFTRGDQPAMGDLPSGEAEAREGRVATFLASSSLRNEVRV